METLAIIIIAVALAFDFLNGFHDAANAIATVVVTRTLKPFQAVLMAGAANFIGYFIFGVAIATMVGKGIIDSTLVTLPIILAALIGAIIWNIITWLLGLPTSSSHALIGGLVGSGFAAAGMNIVILSGVLKVFLFIFIAPFIGMIGAMLFTLLVTWVCHLMDRKRTNKAFKYLQLLSSAVYSVGHGTNDAQKTMGIIALVLFTTGAISAFRVDNWVIFSCHAAIALGTIFGGWRIVKTMGTSITKIRPTEGFCAESSSALVLIGTAHLGVPVSTTHVIAGSIMGVGSVENAKAVRWVTARKIVWAWIITIPVAAIFAAGSYLVVSMFL
ncbi:MAG: inorganic phosphate transporter [archaeon]